ncbi:MAG: hypothetical protein A2X28_06165 [Elusimicrobia bacterium GWA2_56_46]|nr:MAG: hypothetical protein A2X28_06165 [Elusimicrobia bacterium GWA2_56_46]OGR54617.1 MAG: hypothetical protein A2X39_02215 [Elusimicrobia bacterium GWC2_56_31]HBB67747.1 hypothetical protein [Elusimicrobiota bacterium]HBW23902.1 hypothetical protein [Elusimicrobiota bacterium]
MKNKLIVLGFFVLFTGRAGAYFDAGSRYTAGPGGYGGVNIFGELGNDDYYLRPALNTYKSDGTDRYSTYSLGAGLDRPLWRGSAEVSVMPETGGYKNSSIYADLAFNLLGKPADGAVLEDLSLGCFAGVTSHEDSFSLSTTTVSSGSGRKAASSSLTTAFKLNQTDYGLSASARAYGVRLSGRFTKTAYDQDVTSQDRQLPLNIGSIGASGFQDKAVSARVRFSALPLSPEAGYSKTYYLLDQPDSESVNVGLSRKLGAAELSVGWENFNPGGGAAKSDYYSLGLMFSF